MTKLPTFAECAAVPPEKRTALQNMIWDWTHPLANKKDEIPFFRKQLAAVIEEERKERDALAAQLKEAREIIAASQYFHVEDFAEYPADLDESCVSPAYLAHYKRVLAYLSKTKEPTT